MFVYNGPYRSIEVDNFDPPAPPNPSCCSDPRVLCPRCAAEALRRQGFTMNARHAIDDDILPLPSLADLLAGERGDQRESEVVANGDDDLLPLPTINWTIEHQARQRKADDVTTGNVADDDDDILPLPILTY